MKPAINPNMARKRRHGAERPSPAVTGKPRLTSWWSDPAVIGAIGFIVLYGLMASRPGIATWGLSHWSIVPEDVRYLALGAVLVLCLPFAARGIDRAIGGVGWNRPLAAVVFVAAAAAFVVFRVGNHANGDGYFILDYISSKSLPEFFAQLSTQIGDLVLHWVVGRLLSDPMGISIEWAYVFWDVVAGLVGLWAIVRFARIVGRGRSSQLYAAIGVLSAAPVYFWFGHVENYSLMSVAGLWTCVLAVEALTNRRRLAAMWIVFAGAVGLHAIALSLLPAAVYATLTPSRRERLGTAGAPVIFAVGFLLAGAGATAFNLLSAVYFVPLVSSELTGYTAFSANHLLGMLNVLLRTAPLGVIALVAWPWRRVDERSSAVRTVLALGAAGTWYFTFWVNPSLGAPRDWDLLGLFGFPLTLWAVALLVNWRAGDAWAAAKWVVMAALALAHVGGLVWVNQDAEAGAVALHELLRDDPHHQGSYYRGHRLGPWCEVIGRQVGRHDLEIEFLERRAKYAPDEPSSWMNLGTAYLLNGEADKAVMSYTMVARKDSSNVAAWRQMGHAALVGGNWEKAQAAFAQVGRLAPDDPMAYFGEGAALGRLGEDSIAIERLTKTLLLNPDHPDARYDLANLLGNSGRLPEAIAELETAIERDAADARSRLLLCEFLILAAQPDKAAAVAREWLRIDPSSLDALMQLGLALTTAGDFSGAFDALNRYAQAKPDDPMTLYQMGLLQRKLGKPQLALDLLERSTSVAPSFAPPCLDLLDLHLELGDTVAAKRWAHEYVKREPKGWEYPRLQQWLE